MTGGGGNTVEVRLLGGGSSGGSLLSVLVMRLLMHPSRGFLRVVMLAAVHGMVGHHLDELRGGPQWRARVCVYKSKTIQDVELKRRLGQRGAWPTTVVGGREEGYAASVDLQRVAFETAAGKTRSRGSCRFGAGQRDKI